MTFEELVEKLDPQMYQAIKQAVELGKWPDGRVLDKEQKKTCLRAMIIYEQKHLTKEQHTAYMPSDQACASDAGKEAFITPQEKPMRWH